MKKDHEEKIEEMRQKMIRSGIVYGLKNERTIQLSMQLDALLNAREKTLRELNHHDQPSYVYLKN